MLLLGVSFKYHHDTDPHLTYALGLPLTIAQFIAFRATQFVFFQYSGTVLLMLSSLVTLLVAVKTLGLIRAGKLCVPEE